MLNTAKVTIACYFSKAYLDGVLDVFTALSLKQLRGRVNDVAALHKAIKFHKGFTKKMMTGWWLVLGGALVVFVMKINDTSSYALQYSTQTQESVGYWVMGLGGGFLLCLLMVASVAGERKALGILCEEWSAKLSSELSEATVASEKAEISDAEKTALITRKNELEAHLRRLEAI